MSFGFPTFWVVFTWSWRVVGSVDGVSAGLRVSSWPERPERANAAMAMSRPPGSPRSLVFRRSRSPGCGCGVLRGWHWFSSSNLPARGGTSVAGRRGRGVVAAGDVVPRRCAAEHGGQGPHRVRSYICVCSTPVCSQEVSPAARSTAARPCLCARKQRMGGGAWEKKGKKGIKIGG